MSAATGAGRVHVRVPATSANLGPGFDALGLALDLYDDVVARTSDEPGVQIDVEGEGRRRAARRVAPRRAGDARTFDRLGAQPPGLSLECVNRIPHGRGLGSSAAAIVAGVLLARALVAGGADALPGCRRAQAGGRPRGSSRQRRAVPARRVVRGLVQDGAVDALRVPIELLIRPVVLVPPNQSSTLPARGLLPSHVPYADATHSVARAALLMAALVGTRGGADALLAATDDLLHQPYRAASMPRPRRSSRRFARAGRRRCCPAPVRPSSSWLATRPRSRAPSPAPRPAGERWRWRLISAARTSSRQAASHYHYGRGITGGRDRTGRGGTTA